MENGETRDNIMAKQAVIDFCNELYIQVSEVKNMDK